MTPTKEIWAVARSGLVPPRKYRVNKETEKTFVLDDGTVVRKSTMENTYQCFFKTEFDAKYLYWHLRSMYGFDEMDDEPAFNVDAIKDATLASLPKILIDMIHELCEDGLPTEETVKDWLLTAPGEWGGPA